MRTVLIVAGSVWFGIAVVFLLGLVCAAGRRMPQAPEHAGRRASNFNPQTNKNSQSAEDVDVWQPLVDV